MGYHTDFSGELKFKKKLKEEQLAELKKYLGKDRREFGYGDESPLFKDRRPDWYCVDLQLLDDLSGLEWDGAEKTYEMESIINFLIDRVKEVSPSFELCGELEAQGEESDDKYIIRLVDNRAVRVGLESIVKEEITEETKKEFEELTEDDDFVDFMEKRFNEVSLNCLHEDMANFAFGSIKEAIEEWNEEEERTDEEIEEDNREL